MPMKNPPHPGGFVLRQCIEPLGLTITAAAASSLPRKQGPRSGASSAGFPVDQGNPSVHQRFQRSS